VAFGADGALVGFHEMFDDRQAQAGSRDGV
jgi:hypothetical protein